MNSYYHCHRQCEELWDSNSKTAMGLKLCSPTYGHQIKFLDHIILESDMIRYITAIWLKNYFMSLNLENIKRHSPALAQKKSDYSVKKQNKKHSLPPIWFCPLYKMYFMYFQIFPYSSCIPLILTFYLWSHMVKDMLC